MAKQNAAEAMPQPESEKEEEGIMEITDDMVVSVENEEDFDMAEEAKKKTELHKKKAKEATERKKDVAKLKEKLAEVKLKKDLSTAEIKEQLVEAKSMTPEEEEARKAEDKATAAELKKLAKGHGAAPTPEEPETPEIEVTAGDPLAGSAEDRIAFANLVKLPNFDHDGYNKLLEEKEREERNLAAIESGEAKVGWFARRRMKKRHKKLLKQLKPYEEQLTDELLDRQKDARPKKEMTPEEEKRWFARQGMKR